MESFDDAMLDMPDHFVMGTMSGSIVHKLLTQSKIVLRHALAFQMRIPTINEKNDIQMQTSDVSEKKIGLIDFSRPSDYRIKAIEAKSAGINGGDETSHLSGTSRLSTVATSTESLLKTGNTPYEGNFFCLYAIKLIIFAQCSVM